MFFYVDVSVFDGRGLQLLLQSIDKKKERRREGKEGDFETND